jgi:hypothetical protein
LKFSPWEFPSMPWFHRFWIEKPRFGFPFILHDSIDPLRTWIGCQYFWAKWIDPPPKCASGLEAGQASQSPWWHRFIKLQTIRGN